MARSTPGCSSGVVPGTNVLFYTTKRVGGGVQDFEAIKLLQFA